MFVKEVIPRVIKNSRGEKTVQIELVTYEGRFVASAPSGKSKGKSEVPAYSSKGIARSMAMLKVFCKGLVHKNFNIKKVDDLRQIVELVRRFESRHGRFGGNVTYALETVFLKAGAADTKRELWELINDDVNDGLKPKMPMPVGNCIGGGLHSGFIKGKRPDFQEFLLIPKEKTFSRAVTVNLRAYDYAGKLLRKRQGTWRAKKGDEGTWMTSLTNEQVFDLIKEVGKKYKVRIGSDIAASSFYEKGYYKYKNKDLIRDKIDQADYVERLTKKYNLFYVEDGMQEEDFSGFKEILSAVSNKKTLIVGDDLTTTNMRLVRRAVGSKSMNAMIMKPNQIGSMMEVKKVADFCKKNKITMIFSHRSGETMDDALADYCVGFGGKFIKCGIHGRERLVKMKRVMEIEKQVRK